VLNGSPLFTGGAGSGESEIRRHVLENDLVEAIIGLPTDMFFNTGISAYVWVLSNRKPPPRRGKVQLIGLPVPDHHRAHPAVRGGDGGQLRLNAIAEQAGDPGDVGLAHLPPLRPQVLAHLLPQCGGICPLMSMSALQMA
jgi:N-6 DNA Methylase